MPAIATKTRPSHRFITAESARNILREHGFTVHGWSGYCIRRDIPPYGSCCDHAGGQRLARDWKSFHASNVSLHWLRRFAAALELAADPRAVTPRHCGEAWKASRDAAEAFESAEWKYNYGEKYCPEQWSQQKRDNLGVEMIRAEGAAKVAERVSEILREAWGLAHPVAR